MKTKVFFIVLFFSVLCLSHSNLANSVTKCNERGKIDLLGSLNQGGPRSIVTPVEAFLSPYAIDIVFLQNLSNLTIQIVDESENQVYSEKNLSPLNGQQLEISILGWDEGRYTIIISDSGGGYMCGVFEI